MFRQRVNASDNASLKKLPSLLLALSTFLCPVAVLANEAPWVLEKDEDHIQLYTRPVPGSPIIAAKVTARIDASAAAVVQAFGDGDGCNAWQAMCKSSEIIDKVSEAERYVYLVLNLPWPLSDRDMVIHSTSEVDRATNTATVHLQSESAKYPAQDYVRAESDGMYQIKALSESQVEFTYIMHTDIGGEVSPDIINAQLGESMYKDVVQLRTLAEKQTDK